MKQIPIFPSKDARAINVIAMKRRLECESNGGYVHKYKWGMREEWEGNGSRFNFQAVCPLLKHVASSHQPAFQRHIPLLLLHQQVNLGKNNNAVSCNISCVYEYLYICVLYYII